MLLYLVLSFGFDVMAAARAYFETGGNGRSWDDLVDNPRLHQPYIDRLRAAFHAGKRRHGIHLDSAAEAYANAGGEAYCWATMTEAARNVYRQRIAIAMYAGAQAARSSDGVDSPSKMIIHRGELH